MPFALARSGNQLADLAGGFLVAGGAFEILLDGAGRGQSHAVYIIDDLRVDVRIAAINVQARSFGGAGDLAANTGV